jgi:hypothetical protein
LAWQLKAQSGIFSSHSRVRWTRNRL